MIKKINSKEDVEDEGKAGLILTTISRNSIASRDYLRQIIEYDLILGKENYKLKTNICLLLKIVED